LAGHKRNLQKMQIDFLDARGGCFRRTEPKGASIGESNMVNTKQGYLIALVP